MCQLEKYLLPGQIHVRGHEVRPCSSKAVLYYIEQFFLATKVYPYKKSKNKKFVLRIWYEKRDLFDDVTCWQGFFFLLFKKYHVYCERYFKDFILIRYDYNTYMTHKNIHQVSYKKLDMSSWREGEDQYTPAITENELWNLPDLKLCKTQ